jgi:hypothetical protein
VGWVKAENPPPAPNIVAVSIPLYPAISTIVIHHSILKERGDRNGHPCRCILPIEIVIQYSNVVNPLYPDSTFEVNPDTFPVPEPDPRF